MNKIIRYLVFPFLTFLLISCQSYSEFNNGDIIFQISGSQQSEAIQKATNSKYSHMGIIYKIDDIYFVYEAVQTVKLTPIDEWIDRGINKHYVVKRLKLWKTLLNENNIAEMRAIAEKYSGKSYDIYFEWSDNKIYCSELVWKIYKEAINVEIGSLKSLRSFNLDDPTVKSLMDERYGDKIPYEEKVISPGEMFDSDKLFTIITKL